jgi:hypothetical protein
LPVEYCSNCISMTESVLPLEFSGLLQEAVNKEYAVVNILLTLSPMQ